jgi:hypothetical protein
MTKRQINLEFQVKSTDPHRSTSKAVAAIRGLQADLEAAVSDRLPGAKVRTSLPQRWPACFRTPRLSTLVAVLGGDCQVRWRLRDPIAHSACA